MRFWLVAIGLLAALALDVQPVSGQDPQPLEVVCPDDLVVSVCVAGPALVGYLPPYATGDCASNLFIQCTPASGSLFPMGPTPVACQILDPCGNQAACVFTVTLVHDVTPPSITCQATNHIVYAGVAGANVYFNPPIVFDTDPNLNWWCVPPAGSHFPPGTNTVACHVADACGNTNQCSFNVEVRRAQVNGGLLPSGGLNITWDADDLECAPDVFGPWQPAGTGGPGQQAFGTSGAAKFFRPAGPDQGIPSPGGEIAYVATGLLDVEHTPGVVLQRLVQDNDTVGGQVVLSATHGGGTGENVWSGVIQIPFNFYFYGEPRRALCLSKNGLATFSTNVAHQPVDPGAGLTAALPRSSFPPATIACFHSDFIPPDAGHHVRAYLYGQAPNRQVWFIWHGHPRTDHGSTHTALVLEEGHNRLLMVDMHAEFPLGGDTSKDDEESDLTDPATTLGVPPRTTLVTVGVQRDMNAFMQIAASPRVQLVNNLLFRQDNDFYVFKPYQFGRHRHGLGHPALAFADTNVMRSLQTNNIPGATVAVTYKGRLLYNKGFGFADVERYVDMQPRHRASIGSVSKVLTAAGLFKAAEMGLLSGPDAYLNSPLLLGRPWVLAALNEGIANGTHTGDPFAHFNAIQLKHLLSHTAGYARNTDGHKAALLYNSGDFSSLTYSQGVYYFFAKVPFATNGPAKRSLYSNHALGQCGYLIELLSGQSYERFLQDNVLKPIGLDRVRCGRPAFADQDWTHDARRYLDYRGGNPHPTNLLTGALAISTYDNAPFRPSGAGSWTATAADLARFMCATDRRANHADILNTNSLAVMETDPVPEVGSGCHGWFRVGNRYEHNGDIGYGSSYMAKWDDGLNIAVVANTGQAGSCTRIATDLRNQLTPAILNGISPFYDLFGEMKLAAVP